MDTLTKSCSPTIVITAKRKIKKEPVCSASRNLSLKRSFLTVEFGCFIHPGESKVGPANFFTSAGRLVRDRVQNPAASSQEWQRDDSPFSSFGRPVRGGVCERSSTRRLVRGIENLFASENLDCHKRQFSDNRSIEKIFTNVQQQLNHSENEQMFDQNVSVFIFGLFYFCQ